MNKNDLLLDDFIIIKLNSDNSYRVQIQYNGEKIIRNFIELDDAIKFRDEFYKNNNIVSRHKESE